MVMFELVVVDPAELVDASVLELLLVLPLPPLHAVSTAAAASSTAPLVIVSDRFLWYLMGSSWTPRCDEICQ
jgi:hypothetical protein